MVIQRLNLYDPILQHKSSFAQKVLFCIMPSDQFPLVIAKDFIDIVFVYIVISWFSIFKNWKLCTWKCLKIQNDNSNLMFRFFETVLTYKIYFVRHDGIPYSNKIKFSITNSCVRLLCKLWFIWNHLLNQNGLFTLIFHGLTS